MDGPSELETDFILSCNHDADAMEKMLDSDFVFTDYDGTVDVQEPVLSIDPRQIKGARHRTSGTSIDDTEPVSLSRVTHINRGDHRVVDARSD